MLPETVSCVVVDTFGQTCVPTMWAGKLRDFSECPCFAGIVRIVIVPLGKCCCEG